MKLLKILKTNNFLIYLITFLIPYQIYFPIYKDKHITIFTIFVLIAFLLSIKSSFFSFFRDKILFYILFFIVICISYFYSIDKIDALKHIFFLGLGIPIYFVYRNIKVSKENVLKTFVFSSLPLVLLVIYLYFFEKYEEKFLSFNFMKIFIEPSSLESHLAGIYKFTTVSESRVGGVFLNAQVGTVYAAGNIASSLFLFTIFKKWIYILFFLLWIIGLIGFGSLTGIISSIFSTFILLIVYLIKKFYKNLAIIPLIFILVISSFYIARLFSKINPRYQKIFNFDKTFHGRTVIWKSTLNLIKNNWLLGIGLDEKSWKKNYNPITERITGDSSIISQPAHNMYLFIWAKSGIFALIFLLLFLFTNLMDRIKKFFVKDEILCLSVVFFLIWFVLIGMTENILFMDIRICSTFFMLLGLSKN